MATTESPYLFKKKKKKSVQKMWLFFQECRIPDSNGVCVRVIRERVEENILKMQSLSH